MSEQPTYLGDEPITVVIDGREQSCTISQRASQDRVWTLVLVAPNGVSWSSSGQGLWTAFTELRREIEPLGYRLCCAGARLDANMRSGRWANADVVDILSRRTLLGIRRTALVFDYAPPDLVGTVEQQERRYRQWLATPWWRALMPGDLAGG